MTVSELIARLHKLPSGYNVFAGVETFDGIAREVTEARLEHDVACNDQICRYVFLQLGDTV